MAEERVQRRLAAILAADVVGYSRLMRADESGTLAQLKTLRKEVFDPRVAEHNGRIVKTTGDGVLVEFASAVDATECAVDIQRALARRNEDVSEGHRIELRIGINLGDIVVDDDDIYGDGVNVAARLEGLCEAGEVYVSAVVYDQVEGKIEAAFDDLGEHTVKNIDKPIGVYRVSEETGSSVTTKTVENTGSSLPLPDKPSIAVLPFENMSGDPEQDYFADGLVEDLITDISKVSSLFVVSRNTAFAFKEQRLDVKEIARKLGVKHVVEGSVRKMGAKIRINAQLIDAATGGHLWAERYDGNMAEIFDFQDDIREQIVSALQVSLTPDDKASIRRKQTENVEAYDLYLKGRNHYFQYSSDTSAKGVDCLEKAIELDPDFAEAYSYIAAFRTHAHLRGVHGNDGNLEAALEAAEKAVELDPKSAVAHTRLGWVQTVRSEFEAAEASFQVAISLDPELSEAFHYYNYFKICTGDHDAALKLREQTLKLNPFEPLQDLHLGMVRYFQGRLDEAIRALEADRDRTPKHVTLRVYLAAAYAELGRSDKANREIEAIRALAPDYTVEVARKVLPFAPDDKTKLLDGLRKAGLPE